MKALHNMVGGLAGALALNILHQTAAHVDDEAPRVDLVGEEAVTKISTGVSIDPPKGKRLFYITLAGDIISNALFYSVIGRAKNKQLLLVGASLGIAAGIGALTLTKPLGLNDTPITKTTKTELLTVVWYLVGGLVTAAVIKALRNRV